MVAYARQPLSSSMTAELSYIQLKAANEARVSVSASRENGFMSEPSFCHLVQRQNALAQSLARNEASSLELFSC